MFLFCTFCTKKIRRRFQIICFLFLWQISYIAFLWCWLALWKPFLGLPQFPNTSTWCLLPHFFTSIQTFSLENPDINISKFQICNCCHNFLTPGLEAGFLISSLFHHLKFSYLPLTHSKMFFQIPDIIVVLKT